MCMGVCVGVDNYNSQHINTYVYPCKEKPEKPCTSRSATASMYELLPFYAFTCKLSGVESAKQQVVLRTASVRSYVHT